LISLKAPHALKADVNKNYRAIFTAIKNPHHGHMKYFLVIFCCLSFACSVNAQQLALVPYPDEVKMLTGETAIPENVKFTSANIHLARLLHYVNYSVSTKTARKGRSVKLNLSHAGFSPGAYRLTIDGKSIAVDAADSAGIFNGLGTLLQLCKTAKVSGRQLLLPNVVITDKPRYPWRGFMLDESRHFFGKTAVKSLLDWMAFYKLNRFHWHLTDAQGWRIEIKKYPLLTQVGARGNFSDSTAAAQFYTQADIREIVAYARERNIQIVPEIDMPGHATAATRAYPNLSGGNTPGYPGFTFNPAKEDTYTFITDVLKELLDLFPGNTVHIGGDEVAFGIKAWNDDPAVQGLMQRNNFTDLQQAEHYFLKRIVDSLQKLNATAICWDEAVPAELPANNTMITWWRQNHPETLAQALQTGYRVILCPRLPFYFDFIQDSTHKSGRVWEKKLFNSFLDVYHFPENDLDAQTIANKNIIGLQANLWSETIVTNKRLEFLTFPRMASLAEAAWTNADSKNDDAFQLRLKTHLDLYQHAGLYYYHPFKPSFHPEPVDLPAKTN
jgi:hexosaminidase